MHKHELRQRLSPVARPESEATLAEVFLLLCEAIDTPRSLAAYILFREKEYAQLVNLECNPDHYRTAYAFADDHFISKFLSKYPDFAHPELDPVTKAKASFYEWEEACKATNSRFKRLALDPSLWVPSQRAIFSLAKRKIKAILGKPDLDLISRGFGWGPGATTSVSGSKTSAYIKFKSRLDVTSNSLMMGWCCVNSTPSWVNCQLQTDSFPSCEVMLLKSEFHIVRGNEIVLVPKNAKTHRVIAKEPHVNSYLQKGFGAYIRRRLLHSVGVDLKDQSINQRLAEQGSRDGSLATIDLSGASDTISYELVRELLPEDWFLLLDAIRSKQGYLRDENKWLYYQKFSSMGNACTFELESLIFYALAKATLEVENCKSQICNVYGDDIVIPSDAYGQVAGVLQFAGFTVNGKKSYSSGPFRESCGKDYFFGLDVRPIFLKESISNVESIFRLSNSIRRYSQSRNSHYGCDRRFNPAWNYLFSRVDPDFQRFLISDGFGDLGFIVNFDEAAPTLKRPSGQRCGWEGYLFNAIIRLPVKEKMRDSHSGYTTILSVAGSEEPLLGFHNLRKTTYPQKARILARGWQDLGPWV